MADYTFTYAGSTNSTLPTGDTRTAINLAVSHGGQQVGTISPSMTVFTATQQNRLDAKVFSEPLRDIFVVFQGENNGTAVVDVKINPLIWFSWSGFMMLLLGTVIAVWPRPGGRELAAVKPTSKRRPKAA